MAKNRVLSLANCVGISLNLSGMPTTSILNLEDNYAAVGLSAITIEGTVLFPLIIL